MPKVSVIIPVYNVEKYLRECLDSVVNQTLKDIEIILVDDGSTDSSLSICNEYAKKDSRITVLQQDHKGAGAARNKGLEIAQGEYLSILDSDDFFELDMLENMLNEAKKYNLDICICDSQDFDMRLQKIYDNTSIKKDLLPSKKVFSVSDFPLYVFQFTVGWSWDKLFKREFVLKNNLKFQNLRSTNDMLFVYMALALAQRMSYIDKIFVTHRQHRQNQLSRTRNKDPFCFIDATNALKRNLEKAGLYNILEQSFINRIVDFCRWQTNTISPKSSKAVIKRLKRETFPILKIYEKPEEYFFDKNHYEWLKTIAFEKYMYKKWFERIFSLKNSFDRKHKIITVLGIKIKIKRGDNMLKEFLQNIFSIKNESAHKVIRCLGMKIKFKTKKHLLDCINQKLDINNWELRQLKKYVTEEPIQNIRKHLFDVAGIETANYIIQNMPKVHYFKNNLDLLTYALKQVTIDGLYLEFGVYSGKTINHISNIVSDKTVYGFDSFEGLPEDWRSGFEEGIFKVAELPFVNKNVTLIKGWFNDTLPEFVMNNKKSCAFIHVDCDLYSSTKTIFDSLKTIIVPGTIIVFDEYFNYPNWQEHEFKAFQEFINSQNLGYEYIGYVYTHEQVAVKILNK